MPAAEGTIVIEPARPERWPDVRAVLVTDAHTGHVSRHLVRLDL